MWAAMSTRPVLLIDHDADSCERICRLLESHGFNVVAVSSGTAALERLDTLEMPVAVLMNLASPAADTEAFYAAMRQLSPFDHVPLVKVNEAAALEYLPLLLGECVPAPQPVPDERQARRL